MLLANPKVTEPEVPPPVNLFPATTAVISPGFEVIQLVPDPVELNTCPLEPKSPLESFKPSSTSMSAKNFIYFFIKL